MNRPLLIGLIAGLAAWLISRGQAASAKPSPIPVSEAAARLQQAWADHHTVA